MFGRLMDAGLNGLLESPVLEELSGKASIKAVKVLKEHFLLSSYEIGHAFQDSFRCAMATICAGVVSEDNGTWLWERLLNGIKNVTRSSVSKEFSARLELEFFQPYVREKRLSGQAVSSFRKQVIRVCGRLSKEAEFVIPADEFPDMDLVALLSSIQDFEISDFLVRRSHEVVPLDYLMEDFLCFESLLGDAVLFFFRERLRRDPRVERTLGALQREGLWIDLRELCVAQQTMKERLSSQLEEISKQLQKYQSIQKDAEMAKDQEMIEFVGSRLHRFEEEYKAQKNTLSRLPMMLQRAKAAWEEKIGNRLSLMEERLGSWPNVIMEQLKDGMNEILEGLDNIHFEMKGTQNAAHQAYNAANEAAQNALSAQRAIEKIDLNVGLRMGQMHGGVERVAGQVAELSHHMKALVDMMRHMHLTPQIKARDEFSQHHGHSLQIVQKAVLDMESINPNSKNYSRAAIVVGSALSSAGRLMDSERLLMKAYRSAQQQDDVALAAFNLFHVRLRQKNFEGALGAFLEAVTLDRSRFLLFDIDKYIPIRILGAGGMGCAFLCQDEWNDRKVVIKTFWEATFGSLREVFQEAYLMRQIAGKYVPLPLDRGYAYPGRREHPFIVLEYLQNSFDGEQFLDAHGPLNLIQCLHVGGQIARGLRMAHKNDIFHLDLKPSNLLFQVRGPNNAIHHVKIIDFGLARVARSIRQEANIKHRNDLSLMGQQIFGSLDYAPPEQLGDRRYGEPGHKSDLFSFGATMYRLMSHESPRTINRRALGDVPDAFYDLLCDCMQQDPELRPEDADQVVRRIETIHAEVRRTPEQRFRERLLREFSPEQAVLEADDEPELLMEGRLCGLELRDVRRILHEVMNEQGIRFRRELESSSGLFAVAVKAAKEEPSVSEDEKRRVFRTLYQKAVDIRLEKPAEALSLFNQAKEIAPYCVDDSFHLWVDEIKELLKEDTDSQKPWMMPGKFPGETIDIPGIPGASMVWVPAGDFLMGSPPEEEGRYKDEDPHNKVTLARGAWFWQTPVTCEQFEALMGYRPLSFEDIGPKGPIDMVNWHEAAAFCNALSRRFHLEETFETLGTGREVLCSLPEHAYIHPKYYNHAPGFRLPTEAEWEYAARAGSTDARYGELEDIAWCEENTGGKKQLVGQKAPNNWGLYDMLGNVWEWCADWYGWYTGKEQQDPLGPSTGSFRVKRGGSCSYQARLIRVAFRNRLVPGNRDYGLGFRPLISVPNTKKA